MTVQEKFTDYLSKHLNLNSSDIKKVQIHKELRDILEESIGIKKEQGNEEAYSFLTGSYVRNTSIRPPKDVDFFIVLDEDRHQSISPKQLLALLETSVKSIASDKTVFQQTHSVTIEYDEEFGIDIIPAFEINDKMYKIPHVDGSKSEWLQSNPRIHQEILTKYNSTLNDLLVPIIKLLKSWKNDECEFIKSFHLELLTIDILKDSNINTYGEGISLFFDRAEEYFKEPCLLDPANKDNYVDEYINELTEYETSKLKILIPLQKIIANKAVEFEKQGDHDAAINEWDKIFHFNPTEKNKLVKKEPHEQSIGHPEQIHYPIKITAKLYNSTKDRYIERYYSNGRKLPKNGSIKFFIDTSHIPTPYEIKWQPVNRGTDAENAKDGNGDLRGEVIPDDDSNSRAERTLYQGNHYMNCFVIKNKTIVAGDRFFINIR